jgi:uridine phosphorylase
MFLFAPTDELAPTMDATSLAPTTAPLLVRRDYHRPSVFRPENLLREARRQKGIDEGRVPPICVLDPDGDVVRHVQDRHGARRSAAWACYHTELWEWEVGGTPHGIIGSAVGASFAVLVAEQLFASGCELLISIASAGQIAPIARPPYHVLIARALRDEGTSYHYLPPADYAPADPALVRLAADAFGNAGCCVRTGATWTTDAPFRETAEAIAARTAAGIMAVEMEAAALYAFAAAHCVPVLCLAHVSNQLGCVEGDFEKGDGNGACSSIDLVMAFSCAWRSARCLAQPPIR